MRRALRPFVGLLVICVAFAGLATSSSGAAYVYPEPPTGPFVDVSAAPVVVVGVAGQGSSVSVNEQIVTLTPFSVEETLRGTPGSQITIRTLGGRLPNGLVQVTQHEPAFRAGQRSRLFLEPVRSGGPPLSSGSRPSEWNGGSPPEPPGGRDEYYVRGAEQGKQDEGGYQASQTCGASFCLTGQRFATGAFPLTYVVNANTPDVTGEEAAVTAGFQRWEDDPGSSVDFTNGGASSVATTANDGVQVVYWLASGNNFVGRATWFFDAAGITSEFDIEMNDSVEWSLNPTGNQIDIESVIIHEAGHALGLDHVNDQAQIMFPTLQAGTTKRALGSGDLAGIAQLYPGGQAPTPGQPPAPLPPTPGQSVTLSGMAFKVSRSGSTKGFKKVQICAMGTVTQCVLTARGGAYSLTVPAGSYSISATRRRRECHSQSSTGPVSPVTQNLTGSMSLDWFCLKL